MEVIAVKGQFMYSNNCNQLLELRASFMINKDFCSLVKGYIRLCGDKTLSQLNSEIASFLSTRVDVVDVYIGRALSLLRRNGDLSNEKFIYSISDGKINLTDREWDEIKLCIGCTRTDKNGGVLSRKHLNKIATNALFRKNIDFKNTCLLPIEQEIVKKAINRLICSGSLISLRRDVFKISDSFAEWFEKKNQDYYDIAN